ncbi:MAG: hypothetical protein L0027_18120, partial [Candidatus Rokubacteria bacterium]|nr:hypothetical protein [Candidatus Rokubacteria bacterium]
MEPERLFILFLLGMFLLVNLASRWLRWLRWRRGHVRRPGPPAGGPVAGELPGQPPPSPWPPPTAPAPRRVEPPRIMLAELPFPPVRPVGPRLQRRSEKPPRRARSRGL